jgi:hypothetical protein
MKRGDGRGQAGAALRFASVAIWLSVALAGAGCSWIFGPKVDLPENLDEAVANPAIGSRALLRANQTEFELAAWQPAVQGLIDALGQRIDPRDLGALRAAVRRTYAPQRLFDRAATGLADDWDPDAASAQFAFLDSRLGRRILRALATRRDAAEVDRYRAWSAKFAESDFPPERVELMRRLDRALLTSRGAVLVNRAVLDGALASFSGALSGAESAAFGDLRARAAAEESALYPRAADEVLRWNLFVLAPLSDAELARYADFAESPAGQWYVVASARALRMAANGAAEDLFQALRPREQL